VLSRPLRALQAALAIELMATLLLAHDAVTASLSYGSRSSLAEVGIYSLLVRDHPALGTAVVCGLLGAAAAGRWPRLLVPVQFWLTAWFPLSAPGVRYGGDALAGLLVFELLPFFVLPGAWTAHLSRRAVRLQMAAVYVAAGVTKLRVEAWRDGVAVGRYGSDPVDGLVSRHLVDLVQQPFVNHALTWGTPVLELLLALSLVMPWRYRVAAVVVGSVFHVGLAVGFGLYWFQLVMLAGLVVLTEPWRRGDTVSGVRAPGPAAAGRAPQARPAT
jgi:hypothetical protein